MPTTIKDKMFMAIQHYFYYKHRDVFDFRFKPPRAKKLQKTTTAIKQPTSKLFQKKPSLKNQNKSETIDRSRKTLAVISDFGNRDALANRRSGIEESQ